MLTRKFFSRKYAIIGLIFGALFLVLLGALIFKPRAGTPHFLYAITGDSTAGRALSGPMGVEVAPDGRIFVADSGNAQIQVFDSRGKYLLSLGRGALGYPVALVYAGHRLYVADSGLNKVAVFDDKGSQGPPLLDNLRLPGAGVVVRPTAIAAGPGDLFSIADAANQRILVLDARGQLVRQFGSPGSGQGNFLYPNGLALDNMGNIYVADSNNRRIQIFDKNGQFSVQFHGNEDLNNAGPLSLPRGLAVTEDGQVIVVDVFANMVRSFNQKGKEVWNFGGMGTEKGRFNFPNGLAVDRKGRIYVADRENNRVQVFGY